MSRSDPPRPRARGRREEARRSGSLGCAPPDKALPRCGSRGRRDGGARASGHRTAREDVSDVDLRVHEDEIARRGRAERRPSTPLKPGRHRGVRAGDHGREIDVSPHVSSRRVRHGDALVPGRRPRVVVSAHPRGVCSVEDERTCPIRIRGGEQHRHRPAFRVPEECSLLARHRVHDGANIVHACLKIGKPNASVREPRAALVETDEPGEGAEPIEKGRVSRMLPVDLEVREEAGYED